MSKSFCHSTSTEFIIQSLRLIKFNHIFPLGETNGNSNYRSHFCLKADQPRQNCDHGHRRPDDLPNSQWLSQGSSSATFNGSTGSQHRSVFSAKDNNQSWKSFEAISSIRGSRRNYLGNYFERIALQGNHFFNHPTTTTNKFRHPFRCLRP